MPNYCDPKTLHAEIIKSQKDNRLTDYVAEMVGKMVEGLNKKYHFAESDTDDLRQEVVLILSKKMHNIDTAKYDGRGIFCYITTITMNRARQMYRSKQSEYRKRNEYFDYLNPESDRMRSRKEKPRGSNG